MKVNHIIGIGIIKGLVSCARGRHPCPVIATSNSFETIPQIFTLIPVSLRKPTWDTLT